jgi:chromosome segregation protein
MQVKELEIAGFKSFVDPVRLSFQAGITALVGPNGCGKSNVIDALRWIMGEHNARNLRGTKMEDLIFNGSDTRKATGMAEVSLILKNTNGNGNGNGNSSPLGTASEMQITRRLYRSGESEYFINKIPCRLKDIVELFLDSGIGSKSYSIMEQGKVDYILSLKPNDRRILVEEAAGIAKYRVRKKEAVSKMQSTKTNLSRLNDILHELQIQMKGLDLQVKRLKRYRVIKDEIKTIDLNLCAHRLAALMLEREKLETELQHNRDLEVKITADKNTLEADIEKQRLLLTEQQKTLSQLQQDFFELKNTIQQAESAGDYNERELHGTCDQLEKNTVAHAELTAQVENLQQEIETRTRDISTIKQNIDAIGNSCRESTENLNTSKLSLRELQSRLEQENSALVKLNYELTEVKNTLLLNTRLREEVEIKQEKLNKEQQACDTRMQELKQDKDQHTGELNELVLQRANIEKELERLRAEIEKATADLQARTEAVQDVKDKISTLRARLNSLHELQDGLEGFSDGVRTIMNKEDGADGGFSGIRGLIADMISTTARYELAVEAALDRRLQAIIVDSPQDALQAIEHLTAQKSGRVSFIPVGLSHADTASQVPGAERLLDIITIRTEYNDIVSAFLGNIYITDDLPAALKLRTANYPNATFVTLQGEIIDSQCVITGGSASNNGSGILKRNRELREFALVLEKLEGTYAQLTSEREQSEQTLHTFRKSYEGLLQRKQELDIELVQKQSLLDQSERELLQQNEKHNLLALETQQASSQIEKQHNEYQLLNARQEQVRLATDEKQRVLDELQHSEKGLRSGVEEKESQNTELRIDLASLQQKLESLQGNIDYLAGQRLTSSEKLTTLKTEHRQLSEKRSELTESIEQGKTNLTQLLETSHERETGMQSKSSEVQSLNDAVEEAEESLKTVRVEREHIEPTIRELEVKLSNSTIHIDHLTHDVNEKYGCTTQELPESPEPETFDAQQATDRLEMLKKRIVNIGEVNLGAATAFEELDTRYKFLQEQEEDLLKAIDSLQKVILKINRITKEKFLETFTTINDHFTRLFPLLFNGGKAYMELSDEADLLETGINIFAQPPGKKLQSLDLLSGGERALTVIALMFSIFLTKPSPFCLMDEIDAPLDDTNIGRFIDHMHTMAQRSQFIIVTHNKLSMQAADSMYGVTMEERGVSKIVSVNMN